MRIPRIHLLPAAAGWLSLAAAGLFAAGVPSRPDDWPRWRGPNDDGMARTGAPLRWSDTENIAWKAEIPGRGHSSPVVWGNQIFLTTAVPLASATAPEPAAAPREGRKGGGRKKGPGMGASLVEHQFTVMSFDRRDGKLLWKQVAATATPHEGFHQRYGSFASNTPVTDGKRLYVSFGSRGIYCYEFNGKPVWRNETVKMRMRNGFGEGSATVVEDDTLLFNFDQESDSFALALDKATGKERWRVARDEVSTWAPPLVFVHGGRKQVLITGTNRVRAYDFRSGKLIWECGGLGTNPIPAPVHRDGVVYVMTGHREPKLMAIRLGKEGDLTGTDSVLWSTTRGTSYTASPVLHEGKFYMITDRGTISCLDARTGKPYYDQERLPKPYNFKSSLVGADGKLYLSTEDEDVLVVKMGEKFEVLAVNTLKDQSFIATPAIAGGDLYLRGQNTLFCVREKN